VGGAGKLAEAGEEFGDGVFVEAAGPAELNLLSEGAAVGGELRAEGGVAVESEDGFGERVFGKGRDDEAVDS
jgi:hypothetical protein